MENEFEYGKNQPSYLSQYDIAVFLEHSGIVYENFRQKLIKILRYKGAQEPEDLVQEAFLRAIQQITKSDIPIENIEAFIYSVATNLLFKEFRTTHRLESINELELTSEPDFAVPTDELECMKKCLNMLPYEQKQLILEYYNFDERYNKIQRRVELANRLHLSSNVLQVRVYRIRQHLRQCISKCLNKNN